MAVPLHHWKVSWGQRCERDHPLFTIVRKSPPHPKLIISALLGVLSCAIQQRQSKSCESNSSPYLGSGLGLPGVMPMTVDWRHESGTRTWKGLLVWGSLTSPKPQIGFLRPCCFCSAFCFPTLFSHRADSGAHWGAVMIGRNGAVSESSGHTVFKVTSCLAFSSMHSMLELCCASCTLIYW